MCAGERMCHGERKRETSDSFNLKSFGRSNSGEQKMFLEEIVLPKRKKGKIFSKKLSSLKIVLFQFELFCAFSKLKCGEEKEKRKNRSQVFLHSGKRRFHNQGTVLRLNFTVCGAHWYFSVYKDSSSNPSEVLER